MVNNTIRTIYNVRLQTFMLCGLPYKPLPNTTLNEKFNILPYKTPTGYPKLNLITIGIGGDPSLNTNVRELRRSQHTAKDGSLFKHLPFVVRELENDLTDEEKAKYRLRKIENINGKSYVCYYAKVIENFRYEDLIFRVNSIFEDNFIRVYRTENDPTILNPIPNTKTDIMDTNVDYVLNMCKVPVILDQDDMTELMNAKQIMYPDDNVNMISEIGLCTSEDYTDSNGNVEAISIELGFIVDVGIDLLATEQYENGVELYLEIGGMEPLIK